MKTLTMIFAIVIFFILSCVKKELPIKISDQPNIKSKVSFVFINRIGFRSDSTRHGFNDTVFQAVCLDLKYYDKTVNMSYLDAACFNRNFESTNYPLSDSVSLSFNNMPNRVYGASNGSKYQLMIDLVWKRPKHPFTSKALRFNNKRYPEFDTIKFDRDTVIKFIWPDDTASGRYIKGVPI